MNSFDIIEMFMNYYGSKGFTALPSAPLIEPSIPMTFVMSAGLLQIENSLSKLDRYEGDTFVLHQKCFRHFDLNEIGESPIHLSFFEMPGAFSFGNNNKETAIRRMWDFITKIAGIDPDRLWVTCFSGDTVNGHDFQRDTEAYETWRNIGLSDDKIALLGQNHNFWLQGKGIDGIGSKRKCGPNTEVFFDRGAAFGCGQNCGPGCRCGRFVEFANSLFISFDVDDETNSFRPMNKPFNETVIGTERLAMISQDKSSVFDIESIRPIIESIRFFRNGNGNGRHSVKAEQVISDHVRALLFLTADGAPPPGRDGRQRIVKQLIRGILACQNVLGITSNRFLPGILETIIFLYGRRYPELEKGRQIMLDYIENEALRFGKTIQKSRHRFEKLIRSNGGLTAPHIVELVKKYGYPLPLIQMELSKIGYDFNDLAYKNALESWRSSLV